MRQHDIGDVLGAQADNERLALYAMSVADARASCGEREESPGEALGAFGTRRPPTRVDENELSLRAGDENARKRGLVAADERSPTGHEAGGRIDAAG